MAASQSDEGRTRRIGLNEAVFREVNERIDALAADLELDEELDLVCECGDAACASRITISRAEYARLRGNPRRFAVAPGHEAADLETVVERHRGYHVIEKHGGLPTAIAEQTDPR